MFKKIVLLSSVLLAGCGGGESGDTPAPAVSFTVSANAGSGGSVSPASRQVTSGNNTTFTVTADTGYLIASVSGCGGSLSGNTYTTGAITRACVVTASFNAVSVSRYTINATAGEGGSVSPASRTVDEGSVADFTVSVNDGYTIANVSGCGGSLQGNTYTTGAITQACTVTASFGAITVNHYSVNAIAGEGGSISPDAYIVAAGQMVEFTVTPDEDYSLLAISGCAGQLTENRYQTGPVSANCNVQATFYHNSFALMPDPALRAAVLQQLGMPPGTEVTEALLSSLTYLSKPNNGILNLTGLEHARNLMGLQLNGNQVLDISPLSGLAKLEYLNLSGNPISDFTPLAALAQYQNLRRLYLGQTGLFELTFLAEHNYLHTLSIIRTKVSDLSAIAHLPLKTFEASNTDITDEQLHYLQNMPLEVLDLFNTPVQSLDMLAGINFKRLYLTYTAVSDLTFLSGNTQLTTLHIPRTLVTDFTPLLTTGLVENQGRLLYSEYCIKTTGFSRALSVLNTLREAGVETLREGFTAPPPVSCQLVNSAISGQVSATLENQQLSLNWQISTGDTGPYQCEVHTNLAHQLPRLPLAIIENCHQKSSAVLSGLDLPEYDVHLLVDIGLPGGTQLLEAGKVARVDKPASAILSSYDWLQTVIKTNPKLVPGKSAGLRLHVTAEQAVSVPVVSVAARHSDTGSVTLPVLAPGAIPQLKQHDSLTDSYLVEVPAGLMRAGLTLDISMDGIPVTTLSPAFAEVNSIDLTLVPFQLGDIVTEMPASEEVERYIKHVWPLANVHITRREPYQIIQPAPTNSTSSMLMELVDLYEVENAQSYYYGYFKREMNTDRFSGMGIRPGQIAVGWSSDTDGNTLQHELGHNFNLPHAPCGNPESIDIAFPYANGDIGSYGVSLSFNQLFRPQQYKDVMSYCSPEFVSDYNYENVQNYLEQNKTKPAIGLTSAAPEVNALVQQENPPSQTSWYIRGSISTTNEVSIEQILAVDNRPIISGTSELQLRATLLSGQSEVVPVEIIKLGHGQPADIRYFKAYLPGQTYNKLELLVSEVAVFTQPANLLAEPVVQSVLAQNTHTASAPRLTEQRSQVCVDVSGLALDSVTLLWVEGAKRTALAMGVNEPQFCRDIASLPSTGRWELQLRKELSIERLTFSRD